MPTSSARPDDLDAFSRGSRAADEELRVREASLRTAYVAFMNGCGWGRLEADSLLHALNPQFLQFNEDDALWVQAIAELFRRAGGDGELCTLNDAAIAASLRAHGLSDTRGSVTFDDPVAYGFPPTTGYANDPVNTATGNFVALEADIDFAGLLGDLTLARTYNSRSQWVGAFGPGWSSWADTRLRVRPDGAEYEGPEGQRATFPRMGSGFGRVIGVSALVEPLESGLALEWFDGGRWEFDDAGLPLRAVRRPGSEVRLTHDREGRLVDLAHQGGRHIELEWAGDRIVAAACSDGRRVAYGYSDDGALVEVERGGATRRYAIDDCGRILSVSDADGVLEVVNTYDAEGRVLEQLSPFGRRTVFAYLHGRVTVTRDDVDGPANTYVHDGAGRLLAILDGDEQRMAFNYDQWGNPVVITERGGASTIQAWDERGRLLRRVLPTGAELRFAHDTAGRVIEIAASSGAVTRYGYTGDERIPCEIVDPEGGIMRLTVSKGVVHRLVDPDGVSRSFEVDADGNVVATIDADGQVTRFERDPVGRVTAVITAQGHRTALVYDDRGLPVERRDPEGGAWRYEHTPAGRLTSVTDPTGAREETQYGDHGSPTATIDPLGHVTARRYDTCGNVAGVVAADGAAWEYGYDALSRLTSILDPTGATWRREYDVDGNLVANVDPTQRRRTATRDGLGGVIAIDDGLASTVFERDALGRPVARVHPDGARTRWEFDLCSRVVSIEDAVGAITRIEYSPAGRTVRETTPSGRVAAREYDGCGRLAARSDGAGRRWEYRYDADATLVERVDPSGQAMHLSYDAGGRIVEAAEPGRGITRYAYDSAGRTVAITNRDDGTRTFVYDAAGRLVAATDANDGTTRFAYDERGRVTELVDPLGTSRARRYDAAGRLVAETDPLGRTTTVTYDAAGRILERVDGSEQRVRWSYDACGRAASFAAADEPITITRDARGRVLAVDEPGCPVNRFAWDHADRLVERSRGELSTRWRYGADGERLAMGYPDGTETTYRYDAGGYMVGKHHPAVGSIALQRDAAGRLVGATAGGMRAGWRYEGGDLAEYDFDAAGRQRTTQLTRDAVGRVVAATVDGHTERFAYDRAGQLRSAETAAGSFAFAFDANGRLSRETSPGGTVDYEHDDAGQLRVRRGSSSGITEYEYDGAGRRVRERGADLSRTWRWDPLGRLSHIASSRSATAAEHTTTMTVDALGELAEVDGAPLMWDAADALLQLTWLDGQAVIGHGSPWALAAEGAAQWMAPDWQGTIGEARDPLGAASGPDGGGLRLGYRGQLEVGGEMWLRNRVYEPASRTFLQPDPLPPIAGAAWAAASYHYAANNPVGLSDPLGLRPVTEAELQELRERMQATATTDPLAAVSQALSEFDNPFVDALRFGITFARAPLSTTAGLLLGGVGLLTGNVDDVEFEDGVVVFEWDENSSGFSGLTLGGAVNLFEGETDNPLFAHEVYHSYQYMLLGDLFLPTYVAGGLTGLATSAAHGDFQWSCFVGASDDLTYGNPLEMGPERIEPSDNCH